MYKLNRRRQIQSFCLLLTVWTDPRTKRFLLTSRSLSHVFLINRKRLTKLYNSVNQRKKTKYESFHSRNLFAKKLYVRAELDSFRFRFRAPLYYIFMYACSFFLANSLLPLQLNKGKKTMRNRKGTDRCFQIIYPVFIKEKYQGLSK
jgi:hypothetical protein